jgi:hypothetical protein
MYLPAFWSFTLRPNFLLETLYFSLAVKDETLESYNVTRKVQFCELRFSINVLYSNSEGNIFWTEHYQEFPKFNIPFCVLLSD